MEVSDKFFPISPSLFKEKAEIYTEHGERHGHCHLPHRQGFRLEDSFCGDRGSNPYSIHDRTAPPSLCRPLYRAMGTFTEVLSQSQIWGASLLILALLGTNPYNFSRLAEAVDRYAGESGEEIFIQLGHTDYLPQHAKYERFLNKDDLLKKVNEADIVITQGGFGSIADCLRENKKVVAVPRKPALKEAPDDQEELVRELEKLGRLLAVYEIEKLPETVEKAKAFEPQRYGKHKIGILINQFIQENT